MDKFSRLKRNWCGVIFGSKIFLQSKISSYLFINSDEIGPLSVISKKMVNNMDL